MYKKTPKSDIATLSGALAFFSKYGTEEIKYWIKHKYRLTPRVIEVAVDYACLNNKQSRLKAERAAATILVTL